LLPQLTALGEGSHGSVLSENYAPNRLSSGCKSTGMEQKVTKQVVPDTALLASH
jgi:hypothetical protein